jgi:hypothetical protein
MEQISVYSPEPKTSCWHVYQQWPWPLKCSLKEEFRYFNGLGQFVLRGVNTYCAYTFDSEIGYREGKLLVYITPEWLASYHIAKSRLTTRIVNKCQFDTWTGFIWPLSVSFLAFSHLNLQSDHRLVCSKTTGKHCMSTLLKVWIFIWW